jgi:hypothetical protein
MSGHPNHGFYRGTLLRILGGPINLFQVVELDQAVEGEATLIVELDQAWDKTSGTESPSTIPRTVLPGMRILFMSRLASVPSGAAPTSPQTPIGARQSTAWRNAVGTAVVSRE